MEQNNQSTDIVVSEVVLTNFQGAIDKCAPVVAKATHTLTDSLVIANGIKHIKAFLNVPEVRELVEGLSNSVAGFLTDRKDDRPYPYNELCEALTPCLMEGYMLTGNEINIIAGKGMPVKAGKFRKIIQYDGVTDFKHMIGAPHIEGAVAKMRCQATWLRNGEKQTIGMDEEDKCIIAVKYDKYSGIDKLIGLAESKLFSRVLSRMMGKIVIEGDLPDPIDITPEKKPTMPTSNSTVKTGPAKKEVDLFIEEWDRITDDIAEETMLDFEREHPGANIRDLQGSDKMARLNELKTFLQGKQ